MSLVINFDQWPVVRYGFGRDVTDDELRTYIESTHAMLRRKEPYVGLTWMLTIKTRPEHREPMNKLLKDVDEDVRKYCVAGAIMSTSAPFRFFMSSLMLFRPMPTPLAIVENQPDAEKFIRKHAAERGLKLPVVIQPLTGF